MPDVVAKAEEEEVMQTAMQAMHSSACQQCHERRYGRRLSWLHCQTTVATCNVLACRIT